MSFSATRRLRLAILAMVLAFADTSRAADYVIDFWDAARGLPGNSTGAIAQTPEGYLWLGTYDGVARFDGIRFVKFDPSNTPALKHSRIERLFTDAAGTLWINTHDGSLTSWRNGVFTAEWVANERVESGVWLATSTASEQMFVLQSGLVLRRTIDGNGPPAAWETLEPPGTRFSAIFCATPSGDLWIRSRDERLWRVSQGKLEEMPSGDEIKGRAIQSLAADMQGRVFVGTDTGISTWTGAVFAPATPLNGPSKVDVTFIHFTSDGSFWAIADGRLKKGQGRRWIMDIGDSRYLPEDVLQTVKPVEDRNGGVWFAHGGRGLLHVDREGRARRFGPAEGFASERVMSLFQDREANIWTSVDRGGLARIRERRFQLVNAPGAGTGYATVSVTEDRQGVVWIGSAGGGLARFQNGVLTAMPLPPGTRPLVLAVASDEDRLWMSVDREDLWLFEKGVSRPAPFPVHGIKALLVDREGHLWMGRRDGLARSTNGKVEEFGPTQGMGITDVRALAEDAQGTLWIGGGDGSLYRHQAGRFHRIDTPNSGDVYPIWSLLADQQGTIWAGTYRGGLLRLKGGQVSRYTIRQGLVSDVVCQILDDEQGHLWIGSREGILRVSRESLQAVADGRAKVLSSSTYGRADGIPPLECSGFQPGAWRARDGRLWFATTRGAVSVRPSELRDNNVPPAAVIEEVFVDRAVTKAPLQGQLVTIPAGTREVEFGYTGLSLAAPEAVRFRYRLQGLERDWVDASERRTAQYSYLPPGDYRFQVMAGNSDGVWNPEPSSLTVRVLPQIWQTLWFKVALVVLSLGLAIGIARHLSTRTLRLNMARVEQQRAVEADRTRIARDIHDDLGAGLTQISLLSALLRDDRPPEAKAHLQQMGETVAELTRAMDEIVWAVNPSDDTLESLWAYLTHFAQEYLGALGIACRLEAPESIPHQPLRPEVRHNVFLAVKEALNNVVKHAGAREVRLVLSPANKGFIVEIQDDGCGRAASPSRTALRADSGHGLRNIDERMLSIDARFQIADGPNGGTHVRLTVGPPR